LPWRTAVTQVCCAFQCAGRQRPWRGPFATAALTSQSLGVRRCASHSRRARQTPLFHSATDAALSVRSSALSGAGQDADARPPAPGPVAALHAARSLQPTPELGFDAVHMCISADASYVALAGPRHEVRNPGCLASSGPPPDAPALDLAGTPACAGPCAPQGMPMVRATTAAHKVAAQAGVRAAAAVHMGLRHASGAAPPGLAVTALPGRRCQRWQASFSFTGAGPAPGSGGRASACGRQKHGGSSLQCVLSR